MNVQQLIQRISSDPAIDPGQRGSLMSLLGDLARINPRMSGSEILNAIGGGVLATIVSRHLGMSGTGQSIMTAAGIGLGLSRSQGGNLFNHTYLGSDGKPWKM